MSSPVIIIIGAGPGLGMSVARRFSAAGYDIGLIARTPQRLEQLADQLSGEGANVGWAAADVADPTELGGALRRMTDHTGRLDVLHTNAVGFRQALPSELSAADLLADLAIGTASLLTGVRAVLPVMLAQRTGTILATGGGTADRPWPQAATLGVQKAALRNLVQSLAGELTGTGIHAATVTVNGTIADGTPFAPSAIAEVFAELVAETAGPPASWRTVVEFNG
jgi:NADP-dependent 3-hydroxy acid dehydrogenase YdfG